MPGCCFSTQRLGYELALYHCHAEKSFRQDLIKITSYQQDNEKNALYITLGMDLMRLK
ncbi:hypothetical protein XIS1_1430046 [Xenorhabdus innexi]|uniref:Uncharacterized protein n=1 Tax=Xenorhabdus innexi TaxID=290109 RepID=A0A1N6MU23_9GAMM|nr:hypothetical protein XIS1_1430046 [Xenorhabdus innexi]